MTSFDSFEVFEEVLERHILDSRKRNRGGNREAKLKALTLGGTWTIGESTSLVRQAPAAAGTVHVLMAKT